MFCLFFSLLDNYSTRILDLLLFLAYLTTFFSLFSVVLSTTDRTNMSRKKNNKQTHYQEFLSCLYCDGFVYSMSWLGSAQLSAFFFGGLTAINSICSEKRKENLSFDVICSDYFHSLCRFLCIPS